MKITTCFFEDHYLENFHPLTLTRPVFDLRLGILTLGEKWMLALGNPDIKSCGMLREHLKGVFNEPVIKAGDDLILWINPRFIPNESLINQIKSLSLNEGLMDDDQLIAAKTDGSIYKIWGETEINPEDITTTNIKRDNTTVLKNSWELFQLNGKQIEIDIKLLGIEPVANPGDFAGATLMNTGKIYIEEGAKIEPGAILLADKGAIYVGKNAHIMANSVIRGPSAICNNSVVKMGAKIYEETTVGPVCKVGGEIANVIFHSYSNKSHDGYAGNSVFGQWCNLGADTNTSNLKNNYSTVKVSEWNTGKQVDTGQQFIGTIMGDHSKTGINSMLSTGTLCGVCCNLFSDKYPPKFVPSFSWVSGSDIVPYHFEKAIEAMERMMKRRSVELTPAYYNMMKALFQSTSF